MVISIVCALLWTYNGLTAGFDLFGICVTILWWLAVALFTYSYFKRKKLVNQVTEDKEESSDG